MKTIVILTYNSVLAGEQTMCKIYSKKLTEEYIKKNLINKGEKLINVQYIDSIIII